MATEKVNTEDKVSVLMAGYDIEGVMSILKLMSQEQRVNEHVTISEVKDDDYNIKFVVWNMPHYHSQPVSNWTPYFNKSEAMIFVFDSCEKVLFEDNLLHLGELLENEKFDKRPRPLLIWLNNQGQEGAIRVAEFREQMPKKLKYRLKKRLYSIKPVSLLKPKTLRRGFSWLAFEFQKAVEEKQGFYQKKDEKIPQLLRRKKNEEEVDKVRVFMAGLENAGKSTILAHMTREHPKFWKDYSFARLKIDNTIYEVWKVPGQEVERRIWNYNLKGTQLLIFVADNTDMSHTNYDETFDELRHLLHIKELRNVPLLIFLNKLDQSFCGGVGYFIDHLAIKLKTELQNRVYCVQGCVATRGQGYLQGQGFKEIKRLKKKQREGGN